MVKVKITEVFALLDWLTEIGAIEPTGCQVAIPFSNPIPRVERWRHKDTDHEAKP